MRPAPQKWVVQECGCRLYVGTGNVADRIDPDCDTHRTFRCVRCGDEADGGTIAHGFLGRQHAPQRPKS